MNGEASYKKEIDNFIYYAAHELRGPLATIRGLINLVKIRQSNDELERLIQLIDSHATKLDERLFRLTYMARPTGFVEGEPKKFCFPDMETRLRKIIEKNSFVDFLEFHFTAPEQAPDGLNETMLSSLLDNMLLHILSLPKTGTQSQISFKLTLDDKFLKITAGCLGFTADEPLRAAYAIPEFSYTDLVRYPQMTNFYCAMKLSEQLEAKIKLNMPSPTIHRMEVEIPLHQESVAPHTH